MAEIELKVLPREGNTKGQLKDLRCGGVVPGIVYGRGKKPTMLKVEEGIFRKAMRQAASGNAIIKLVIEGAKKEDAKTVILKEVQRDPITGNLVHIDFQEISLTEKIKVNVQVVALGEAIGVTQEGGVLERVLREIEVECLPTAIPEKIEVDITGLSIGKAVYVKDLKVPEGVRILNDHELTVLSVSAPAAEIEAAKPEEEGAAEPEVIKEKKTAEGEEGAEGGKEGKEKEKKEEKSEKGEKKPEKKSEKPEKKG